MRRPVAALMSLCASAAVAAGSPAELLGISHQIGSRVTAPQVQAAAPATMRLEALLLAPEVAVPAPAHAAVAPGTKAYANLWDRIRDGFAIPELESPQVERWQARYLARPQILNGILERSRRYLFHVAEEIAKRGMPMELALLPMVESGYDPAASSPAQAAGLWQFVPATARDFNLNHTPEYDARRDIVASTNAALDYLRSLYELFGDWHLALAAYNWGEKSVAQAIEHNAAKGLRGDYASLTLPQETRDYVPKLLALKRFIAEPSGFRLELRPIANEPYFTAVATGTGIDLEVAARLANVSLEEVTSLNPGFMRPGVSKHPNRALVLPVTRVDAFLDNFSRYEIGKTEPRAAKRRRTTAP